ncbi:ABC transporter ATP-binding protein [Microbacterium murale]|uniref:Iron complex transport system ATP-binding protein n=1 Tax=Microbacterium murale TaxID=1081040 RepID=A0ABU0PAC8_9MICO|nr:ABC transporter ATP-binding protein [Microbacterium murale]MDQ0643882.1 iron complex transport system ATP-binding protein [Microbacterium murale]
MTHTLPTAPRLNGTDLRIGYGGAAIIDGIDVEIPPGELTVIIGPNACGKSTLLRSLARLLKPESGSVLLDGTDIRSVPTKELARRLGLLPQTPIAPDGITVQDLVSRGRYPHQTLLRSWSLDDENAVADALSATEVSDLAERRVDELSGGQRQRVWIAMALAQETAVLLLDEPTTFLDIGHQNDVMELISGMQDGERTIVAVLHDINQAARFATNLIAMKDGRIIAEGAPGDIVTADLIHDLFGLSARVIIDPVFGCPVVLPGIG